MGVKEGDTVVIQSLGTVRVEKIFPSGSGRVVDLEGRTWVVTADLLETVEQGLFTMA